MGADSGRRNPTWRAAPLYLVPVVGDWRVRQVGAMVGAALVFVIAFITIRWLQASTRRSLLPLGVFWLVLMVGFEVLGGRLTAIARHVLDERPHAVATDPDLREELKQRVARAGIPYDGNLVGQALFRAQHRRERFVEEGVA